eukprot:1142729-Pelagomonas_calceolata.AAC.2
MRQQVFERVSERHVPGMVGPQGAWHSPCGLGGEPAKACAIYLVGWPQKHLPRQWEGTISVCICVLGERSLAGPGKETQGYLLSTKAVRGHGLSVYRDI